MSDPENQTNSKNHTNPSRTHKITNPKKLYKPRNQTHKKKIIKEYCTKQNQSIYIYILKPNYPKEKIDLNLKIKSIQSLTKYPQN